MMYKPDYKGEEKNNLQQIVADPVNKVIETVKTALRITRFLFRST